MTIVIWVGAGFLGWAAAWLAMRLEEDCRPFTVRAILCAIGCMILAPIGWVIALICVVAWFIETRNVERWLDYSIIDLCPKKAEPPKREAA